MSVRPHRSTTLDVERRRQALEALGGGEEVDVLIVGGGVTGTGVALEAASRGLSVALVERRDLAHGTSRWSSKLVHGGLRYLAQGDVAIAYESARERGILMERTAPHLTRALPFVIPLNDNLRPVAGLMTAVGGRLGNVLRAAARTSRGTLPPARRISASEAALLAPDLRVDDLRGALLFWDGQLTDDARLVIAIARTAASFGARILTYCEVESLDAGRAVVADVHGGSTLEMRARHVVNATGVWADQLDPTVSLRPSKGVHLVVRAERLGNPRCALMVPVPGSTSRFVFTLPQGDGRVLIGLTDTPLEGPMPDVPEADEADERTLLATINLALDRPLAPEDVIGSFAGLRPLLAAEGETAEGETADLSRRHRLSETDDGLLTLVGGKLTTYRRMAQDAVDRIAGRPGVVAGPSRSSRLPLVGAASRQQLTGVVAPPRLVRRYGTEAPAVLALADNDKKLGEPVTPGHPSLGAELAFGLLHEGALNVDDLLDRRTRIGLAPADRAAALPIAQTILDGALQA